MDRGAVPTLEDVARAAKVSTATVSRCLNSPERVVEETRLRVMAAVRTLGYSPNFGARALAARRTNTIGAIIPTMENAIFARGLQAFQETLNDAGVTLLVASSSYRADLEEDQIRTLTARGADGLLLIGFDRDPQIYRFLERQGVPALVVWAFEENAVMPCIGFDNRQAMYDLAHAALAMGHRRIGVISAPVADNDRARSRLEGIGQAMEDQGLASAAMTLIETPYGIEQGAVAFGKIMQQTCPPTLVLCGNDVLGVGAMKRARDMGLSVPRDVSITGFDDIELAKVTQPGLATVHVPHREMGKQAARALVAMVAGDDSIIRTRLPTDLALRGSLGPPQSAR
jgi:LacI family transcriptional regulator